MSIIDKTGQAHTVTEFERALKLFTDRREALRLFAEYVNDDPPRERIIFFHGDGGNGKTLLLKYLRENYCKRLRRENWEYVRAARGEEFSAHVEGAEGAEPVPSALVDFGVSLGDYRPQEAFSALLKMRRDLAGRGLRFPLYDFACVWYLHRTGGLTEERRARLFPPEELEFIAEIADAVSKTSWGALSKVVLNIFSKHSRDWLTLYRQRRRLDESRVEAIQRMDPESELVVELPHLFASDLNAAMAGRGTPGRVVLFFDTHEALWGTEKRDLSGDLFFYQDEWLRRLLASLEFSSGVVAVVAGRDRPRWAEAGKIKIPAEYLDAQLVGHLSEADAALYMERAGVTDAGMCRALIAFARVAPDQVHPFYLGLCLDIIVAAAGRGARLTPADFRSAPQAADKEKELVDRLLRYVNEEVRYAIRALSACRAFNREVYLKLGGALAFPATEPAFQVLTRFSFVWQTERRGDGWYRVHDLLRRLMRERGDEVAARADEVLEKHYRERAGAGDAAGVAEAIYHANRRDWERGVSEWRAAFGKALELSRYKLCRALLEVRNELSIQTDLDRGMVSAAEGDYHTILSRHEEARQEYLEAVASYDKALRLLPDDTFLRNQMGIALRSLGEVQTQLSQYGEAVGSYNAAIAVLDEALRLAPDDVPAHNSKGNALRCLGEAQTQLSQYREAVGSFGRAIEAFDEALRRAPDDMVVVNNKGVALQSLGEAQTFLSRHRQAIDSFHSAIEAFDSALLAMPDDLVIHSNKGFALQSPGQAQVFLSRHGEAVGSYRRSIDAYDEALRLAPDYVYAHNGKGLTLRYLGELQSRLSQHEEAVRTYRRAVASYDEALRLAPANVVVHNNKGFTLQSLGESQARLSRHDEAAASFNAAIAALDEALRLAPDYVYAHNNRGIALRCLGESQTQQGRYEEAVVSLGRAIESFDAALGRAPGLAYAHNNKGIALRCLGEAQVSLSRYDEAVASYHAAIAVLDEALRLTPDLANAHNHKGNALRCLGEVQARLSRPEEAVVSFEAAVASYGEALRLAPDYVAAHNGKGLALLKLGEVQAGLPRPERAETSWRAAWAEFSRSLEIAVGDGSIQELKDRALALIEGSGKK